MTSWSMPEAGCPATWDGAARAAQAGDLAAREALFTAMSPWLAWVGRRAALVVRTLPTGWAETTDLQQEQFLVLCELLAKWNPARSPWPAYVGAVLPGRLSTWLRAQTAGRGGALAEPADGEADHAVDPGLLVPDPAAEVTVRLAVRAELAALDPLTRAIIVRYVLGEEPMEAIARALGLPPRMAYRLYHAGRAVLREYLGDDDPVAAGPCPAGKAEARPAPTDAPTDIRRRRRPRSGAA